MHEQHIEQLDNEKVVYAYNLIVSAFNENRVDPYHGLAAIVLFMKKTEQKLGVTESQIIQADFAPMEVVKRDWDKKK